MRCVVTLIIIAMPLVASAGELHLHMASKHIGALQEDLNETNYGLGWRGDGELAPVAGGYKNSYSDPSLYAGANYRLSPHWSISGVGITGYDRADILPVPLLHFDAAPEEHVSPMLTVAPAKEGVAILASITVDLY